MDFRHMFGDVALAVLIAAPTLTLTRPTPAPQAETVSSADNFEVAMNDRRVARQGS